MAYLAYKHADSATNILDETRYLIEATLWNHLGDSVCCVVKKIVAPLEVGDQEWHVHLDRVIDTLKKIKLLLGVTYRGLILDTKGLAQRLNQMFQPWLNVLDRIATRVLLKLRRDINHSIVSFIRDLTHGKDDEYCLPMTEIGMIILGQVKKVEDEYFERLLDLFDNERALFKADMDYIEVVKGKDKMRQVYHFITHLIDALEELRLVTSSKCDLVRWLERFMVRYRYNTRYDRKSGRIVVENLKCGEGLCAL